MQIKKWNFRLLLPGLLVCRLIAACNGEGSDASADTKPDSAATKPDTTVVIPKPQPDSGIHFSATKLINFDLAYLPWHNREPVDVRALNGKKDRALFLLDSIVSLPEFEQEVLKAKFTKTNGLSNAQIYQEIISPKYDAVRRNLVLDLDTTKKWNVDLQRGNTVSIGYELGDDVVHTVQIQLVKYLSAEDYAAHILHEYMHAIGFSHKGLGKWKGVPYGVQHIVEKLLEQPVSPDVETIPDLNE